MKSREIINTINLYFKRFSHIYKEFFLLKGSSIIIIIIIITRSPSSS